MAHSFLWTGDPSEAEGVRLTAGHDRFGKPVDGSRAHYPNLSGDGLWTTPADIALLAAEVMSAWHGLSAFLPQALVRRMLTGYGCACV